MMEDNWNFDLQDEQQEVAEIMAEMQADFDKWYKEEILNNGLFESMNL